MKTFLLKLLTIIFVLTLCLGIFTACGEEEIDNEIFSFTSTTLNEIEGYALTGIANKDDTNIVIPETYNNKPVLAIDLEINDENKKIKNIEISSSIIRIESRSFYNFRGLEKLSFQKNSKLKYIGEGAFELCTHLNSIEIPESVMEIGKGAFSYCVSLENIEIPSNIKNIEDNVFYCCKALKSIKISKDIQSIGENAFSDCTNLIFVECEENSKLSHINNKAFYNCSALAYVEIPNSIENIDNEAFLECNSLIYNVKDGLKYLGNINNKYLCLVGVEDWNISSAIIQDDCKYIGDSALENCWKLNKVVLPDTVKIIRSWAFSNCDRLQSINISNSIEYIGYGVFSGCNSLNYNLDGGLKYLGNDSNNYLALVGVESEDITSAVVNEKCKIISEGAFSYLRSLIKITIPNSVCYMGNDAFNLNYNLVIYCETKMKPNKWPNEWNKVSPVVWDCVNNKVADDGCIYVEEDGLRYKIKDNEASLSGQSSNLIEAIIKPVIIYNEKVYAVTSIEDGAFSGCLSLKNVEIPRSVGTIGDYAFSSCKTLEKIIIPNNVKSIGNYAFNNCSSLTIYCEVLNKPDEWDDRWCDSLNAPNCLVVWGHK